MKSFGKSGFGNVRCIIIGCLMLISLIGTLQFSYSQSRIPYAGRNIFISGINIAWSSGGNFARDLAGPLILQPSPLFSKPCMKMAGMYCVYGYT